MKCTLITIIFAIFVSVWARAEDLESNKGNNLFLEKAQDLSHAVFPEKPEKDVTAENNKNLLGKKEEQDHGLPEHSDIQRDREVRRYKRQNPVPYETVGCFKDRSDRAVPTIEGHDPLLDGYYGARKNAIEKCYRAAKKRGFQVFAVQHGGWCATSAGAEKTFDKYGRSSSCKADGEGGPWANQVYYIKDYSPIGCYKDTSQRAIQTREGHDTILDGNYKSRKHAIAKCAVAARRAGYTTFAVQDGGWCSTSATAEKTFDKYGRSSSCNSDGEGGPWANQVYYIKDYSPIGCYIDASKRAIQTREGHDTILDGNYKLRKHAIAKCAVATRRAGYTMFAVQDGGRCATSATAEKTFDKYGRSYSCDGDGEGGPWANQVYYIKENPVPYETVGCFKDRSDRAVPTIEGHDLLLDGYYGSRRNAIEKCYRAAKKRGFQVFAVQDGGWCATSAKAEKTFDKYGRSSSCKADGEGGPWANQVYYIKDYSPIGCYKDTSQRAIQAREGHDAILDGNYKLRKHAIAKCAVATRRAGYTTFAVQDGGWCSTNATAEKTFDKYGRSSSCNSDGEGGPWANQVYFFKDYSPIGCYNDTSQRAIQTREGHDAILDGNYWLRKHAIAKCAVAARRAGYTTFAVQDGGWCATSATAEKTFDKYGRSYSCDGDGEGGPWANQVYYIRAKVQTTRVTIRLTITNYSNHAIRPVSLTAPQGTTAFQLLQLAARRNPCYRFKYKWCGIGRLITSICCVDQDPKAKLYWLIYINGKLSPVGVDLLKPKAGDRLTFKYQKTGQH